MLERFGAADSELPDSETTLWRFMDFTKFVSMLHRQALFFARADQLPDPFEGYPARRKRQPEHTAGRERELHEHVFLSCWHQNDHESAAMWRLYLSYEDGVAIRSNPARLNAAFKATEETLLLARSATSITSGRASPRSTSSIHSSANARASSTNAKCDSCGTPRPLWKNQGAT